MVGQFGWCLGFCKGTAQLLQRALKGEHDAVGSRSLDRSWGPGLCCWRDANGI